MRNDEMVIRSDQGENSRDNMKRERKRRVQRDGLRNIERENNEKDIQTFG